MSTTTNTNGIPDQHRVTEYDNAEYGRPRFRLHYYDQGINATAFRTFSSRHEAVGVLTKLEREGRCEHPRVDPRIEYEESY